jgi:hypothetical protein
MATVILAMQQAEQDDQELEGSLGKVREILPLHRKLSHSPLSIFQKIIHRWY